MNQNDRFRGIDAAGGHAISRDVSQSQPVNPLTRVRRFAAVALFIALSACSGDAGRAMSLGAQAQQQFDAGQVTEARTTIIAAIKQRDDLPALHLIKGRIELAANRLGAAFDSFAAALALDTTNPEALQGVAQLGLRTGHISESEDAAERILALQPDQPDALLVKGLLALVRFRPAEAVEAADRILAANPGNEGGAILKARALYMLGDGRKALDFLDKIEQSRKDSEGLARTRLELLREARDGAGMADQFAVLRQFVPKDVRLRIDEANLHFKNDNPQQGRRLLRHALFELDLSPAQTTQVVALWREYDRNPLGPADLDRLAKNANEAVRVEVARFYLDTGEPAIARRLVTGDRSIAARSLAARAAIAAGEVAAGAALAERILAEDETQCDALLARSAARLLERQTAAAVVAAQTAVAECPQSVAAHRALATAYNAKRDPQNVRRAFSDGIARNPQSVPLSEAFVAWLETRGEVRQAIAEARRLTRKAPATLSAWEGYRRVCERQRDAACSDEARAGLTSARSQFGLDLAPGTLTERGLFGRLPRR